MQICRVRPFGAKRLAFRFNLLLGGGSGLDVFPTLFFIGIERLNRNVTARGPLFFAAHNLGKVMVCEFLRGCLLIRRGLTNHKDSLTQAVRTGPARASAYKQCNTGHKGE